MKDKDMTTSTKVKIAKTIIFPVMMYGCESWTIRKAERKKIDSFEMSCWRRFLRVSWTEKRANRSIIEQINLEISLEARLSSSVYHRVI